MNEHLPTAGTFYLKERLTLKQRLLENRAALTIYSLVFFVCVVVGFIFAMVTSVTLSTIGLGPLTFMLFFVGGMLVGVGTVSLLSVAGRIKNRLRLKLGAIEERLSNGTSHDIWQDLQTLVDGNLKLKRLPVADFYSRRLFELSHGAAKLSDVMLSTECWANTKAYQKSTRYWLFWLFQSRGTLCLSSQNLQYSSNKLSFDLPLSDIVKLSIARHPRWLKPIPLNYIVIDCLLDGEPSELYLTPSLSQADNIWQVNAMIKTWLAHIAKAKAEQLKRVASSSNLEPGPSRFDDSLPHQLSA